MMGVSPSPGLWTPAFVRVGAVELAYFLAAGVLIYALPLYAVGPVGSDERGAGIAFGAFTLTALVLRPFAGRLVDRVGRRPLLAGGALLAGVSALGFLAADTIVSVTVVRLVSGVAEAAFLVATFAVVADIAPPSRTGEALSYNSLALYLGIALGPLVGEWVVGVQGFSGAWWAAALLAVGGGVVALGLAEPARDRASGATPEGDAPAIGFIHRPTLAPSVGFLAGLLVAGGFLAFAVLRGDELGMAYPSVLLFAYGGAVIGVRLLLPRAADRHPPLRVLALALAVTATGGAAAAAAPNGAALVGAAAIVGTGVALLTPAFFAAVFTGVPPSQRGAASGTATMAIDLGLGVGPIIAGSVARSAGIPVAFASGAALAVLGCVWTLRLQRRRLGDRAAPTA
jgi:MFS family permease